MTKSVKMNLDASPSAPSRAAAASRLLYLDQDLRGFCVVASGVKGGKTSYAVQREVKGRTRRVTIAQVGSIPFKDAKARAGKIIADLNAGVDPKARARTGTLAETLELYLKKQHNLRPKRPRATAMRSVAWARADGSISRSRISSARMSRTSTRRLRRGSRARGADSGQASANATMRALRAVWNFAADRDEELKAKGNPVRLKKMWFDIDGRETIVEDADKPWSTPRSALPNPIQRDYILFLLYTGARREEAASLRWEHVNLAEMKFKFPKADTKSKKQLELPITQQASNSTSSLARPSGGREMSTSSRR